MMRPLFLAIGMLFAACGGEEPLPDAPLDRATFERVLTGALIAEARIGLQVSLEGRRDSIANGYYRELYRKQGVSEADFKATYEAYLAQPERLKAVYQDVLDDLQHQADTLRR